MIPGDIDLTENLDFRKSRRKELPSLPWYISSCIINDDDNIMSIANYIVPTSTTLSYNNIYYDDNIITDISEELWINDTFINDFTSTTNSSSTTLILDNNIVEITNNGISLTNMVLYNDKPKKDIFGNIIPSKEIIPKICYEIKEKISERIPKLPWETNRNLFINECDNRIPWKKRSKFSRFNKSWELDFKPNTNPICYLEGKSSSFIRSYLNRETEDNHGYLTNMGYLRIHDAIIE